MLDFRKKCNHKGILYNMKLLSYFSKIMLSPLYTTDTFHYIPAFSSILGEKEDDSIKKFFKTRFNNIDILYSPAIYLYIIIENRQPLILFHNAINQQICSNVPKNRYNIINYTHFYLFQTLI